MENNVISSIKNFIFTCIALLYALSSIGQSKDQPLYDTSKGIVVYYDLQLNVRADTAIVILKADETVCQHFNIMDCGFYGREYYKPYWYEWRVFIVHKNEWTAIPVKNKITFNKD